MSSTRIAMWSGPRNISTALMRSWGARGDCFVSDEPLYAHYLSVVDESIRDEHPGYEEILESQSQNWKKVVDELVGEIPRGRSVWYQKHMAHHLTNEMSWNWISGLTNCFLIREPRAMITSFIKVIENPTPEDLGLPLQVKLFEWVRERTGQIPAVIDSKDVLMDPEGMLSKLCTHCGIGFDRAALQWESGPREEDGVWAPHWYSSVNQSTGFAPYKEKNEEVPERLLGVLEECNELYDALAAHRIT